MTTDLTTLTDAELFAGIAERLATIRVNLTTMGRTRLGMPTTPEEVAATMERVDTTLQYEDEE